MIPHGTGLTGYYHALARLPQVAGMWTSVLFSMALPVPGGVPDEQVDVVASPDGALGVSADRVRILQGRIFDAGAVREVMVDQQLARREHLRPGATLHLLDIPSKNGNPDVPHAVPLAFRVSAVVAFDDQVVPATAAERQLDGFLPDDRTCHLDRGYDSTVTRHLLDELGFDGAIARKGVPAPVQAGTRWVVERTHAWMNGYGKLRRCTERDARIVDFYLYLAAAIVTIRRSSNEPAPDTAGTPARQPNG